MANSRKTRHANYRKAHNDMVAAKKAGTAPKTHGGRSIKKIKDTMKLNRASTAARKKKK